MGDYTFDIFEYKLDEKPLILEFLKLGKSYSNNLKTILLTCW